MKVGKSTFIYALSIAVARGTSFLRYPTAQGAVLIVALEEHPRDVRRRLEQFGMRADDPIYVATGPLDQRSRDIEAMESFHCRNRNRVGDRGHPNAVLGSRRREFTNAEVIREVSPILELARRNERYDRSCPSERKSGGR